MTERRWTDRFMRLVPYVALICSTGLAKVGEAAGIPHQPWPIVLGSVAVTATWVFWWVTRHPEWEHDERRMAVFFTGLIVLIFLLVWCGPLFGFFAWTGYVLAAYALRGWRQVAGGTLVAIANGLSQVGGFYTIGDRDAWLPFGLLLLINVGVANVMIKVTASTHEQNARRARTIDELGEANAKLAAALEENAGLHSQLLTQAREAGKLDERHRMAGEIHDVLAQGLTGIVTQLEAADAAELRPADRRRHIDNAKRLARESLAEARRSVRALRPQTLDEAALPEAIGEVVTGWSAINGVTAELITTGAARPLLPEIETTLLRTAQEALANVARHAGAGRVGLTLSYMEDVVTLDVRDDGAGFAVREIRKSDSFGLVTMRERLLRVAGTLEVESEPGQGTALSACVPAIGTAA